MANRTIDRLRGEALNLPQADRAELACQLVQSLDGPADADAASEWDAEILRRIEQVTSGSARIVDRAEFARHMRKRLARL
jgi:putative addiction module component (TIGR02574 family)